MSILKENIMIQLRDKKIDLNEWLELTETIDTGEILRVPYRIGTTMYRSMAHASRFFREIRDNSSGN
jgi:hypothetical protein